MSTAKSEIQSAAILLALVVLWTASAMPGVAGPPDGKSKPEEVVAYAKKLSLVEFIEYLSALGKAKDLAALTVIYNSDSRFSSFAAGEIVGILDPEKAVAFCANLELASLKWQDAVYGLRKHPKEKVIGYLKQIATSSDREARYICYCLCQLKGWDDLVPYARRDLGDGELMALPSMAANDTLGKEALEYIESCKKKK
jgi:hypothetical protein